MTPSNPTRPEIAVVDDDPEWAQFVCYLLKSRGYNLATFPTSGRFFDALIHARYALVVLDMRLPGMHGKEVIRVLRSNPETRRMLIVAVSGEDVRSAHAVAALEAGADEYLAKPVEADFLAARIAALLRRSGGDHVQDESRLCVGPLAAAPERQEIALDGRPLEMSNLEFQLLLYFMRNPNRVLTRSLLLEQVWGVKEPMNTRTVDKHVEALRRMLGPFGKRIETVVKVGYCLKV